MIILVLNCGSSSIKYQVLDMKSESEHSLLAKGLVERIGMEESDITHSVPGADKFKVHKRVADHTEGIKDVLGLLVDPDHGVLRSLDEIEAVGHRVVHGGEYFTQSCIIDQRVKDGIEKCASLAPLHNPAGLLGINAVESILPKVPQVAVFDTSFLQTIPNYAYIYGLHTSITRKTRFADTDFTEPATGLYQRLELNLPDWITTIPKSLPATLGTAAV